MTVRLFTIALVPTLALVLAYVLGPVDAGRLFRADLGALVATVALGAFLCGDKRDAAALAVACLLPAGAHVVVGGALAGGLVLAALSLACATAAWGLVRLAAAVGTPLPFAGVLAMGVLCAAMSGLFWADPLSARLPQRAAYEFRQAALQLDPAMAVAYGASGFDRLHAGDVYSSVPLASSTHEPPRGLPTALLWLTVGLVSGALGLGLGRPDEV